MKIKFCWSALAAALLLAGCAQSGVHSQVAAGAGGSFEGYSQSSGHDAAEDSSSLPDYRQIISDPGPF